jgi:SAM-dependent methyltransferase
MRVDDPCTTLLRRKIIKSKPFLRKIYIEWYEKILANIVTLKGDVLELGSGAGFIKELNSKIITSEILELSGVDIVADACKLPFNDSTLDAIVMTDVFHHIPNVKIFLNEASRVLRPGGKIVMVEPWNTRWSLWVYTRLHSEPFITSAESWEIPSTGPLSGANGALPWLVFRRDRKKFENLFATLKIKKIEPFMPISYLLSGGVSMRSLIPGFLYKSIRFIEDLLDQDTCAMFVFIEIERQ